MGHGYFNIPLQKFFCMYISKLEVESLLVYFESVRLYQLISS